MSSIEMHGVTPYKDGKPVWLDNYKFEINGERVLFHKEGILYVNSYLYEQLSKLIFPKKGRNLTIQMPLGDNINLKKVKAIKKLEEIL